VKANVRSSRRDARSGELVGIVTSVEGDGA
jgi:hypothetical protein